MRHTFAQFRTPGGCECTDLCSSFALQEAAQEEWGKVSTCLPDGTPCSSSDDELVCELKGGDLNKARVWWDARLGVVQLLARQRCQTTAHHKIALQAPTPWPTPISTATDASIERLCARMLRGRSKTLEVRGVLAYRLWGICASLQACCLSLAPCRLHVPLPPPTQHRHTRSWSCRRRRRHWSAACKTLR